MTLLETIYYLSSPVLVVIAGIGLWQLKIAKDNARTNAQRQAITLAAERCEHYLQRIIPLTDIYDEAIEKEGIKFFQNAKTEIDGKKVKIIAERTEIDDEKLNGLTNESLAVYNSLEAFATFFTSGAADEVFAFDSVGHSYVELVKDYLPDIILLNDNGKYFNNMLELFFLWNGRAEAMELLRNKESIEAKLKRVNNKFISPLGTK